MRKKTVIQKSPRAKILKLPKNPRTSPCSKDHTFTPSPSPPTSPPRTDPMECTKITPRFPSSSKPSAPPSAPSQPSTSKRKRPAVEEPMPEPSQPKPRSTLQCSQRGHDLVLNEESISDALKYTDVGTCVYTSGKWDDGLGVPYRDALAVVCENISLIDGLTLTYKSLGYLRAQLHRIMNHIILL
ncbi:uncharacterized protein LOC130963223 [Arachis stenosperma]|uniref:uncharacterized protein LOC130963223 n=1 Tax=Arachis stenosperma TaxID=217475 RepID=UPI0025ACDEF8|nr:uncharacterized protein LOC130963223 [Arachis stenosperma]